MVDKDKLVIVPRHGKKLPVVKLYDPIHELLSFIAQILQDNLEAI